MNHEFWNEIGNLYFMSGAYEPAIHAYLRSIKLENTFGRSYSNLAMAYVQTGKYDEAIKLYHRSIELISDKKEKATTWNRLGILYRQIKKYDYALEAYQRADLIMPQNDDEKLLETQANAKLPLTVSMPEINLDAILAKGHSVIMQTQGDLQAEINGELEIAEPSQLASQGEEFIALPEFEYFSQTEDSTFKPPVNIQSEWGLAYEKEALPFEEPTLAIQEIESIELEKLNSTTLIETRNETIISGAQINVPSVSNTLPELVNVSEVSNSVEDVNSIDNATFSENNSRSGSVETVSINTDAEVASWSQTDAPVTDLSPEERESLRLEIAKCLQATSQQPRSYLTWERLGEVYKSAGQYGDAIGAFQKAILINPRNSMSHYRLGLVYAAERKEQEAINSFTKVLELNPNSAQAHASLASQYRKMGFEKIAQEHIEKARSMQLEDESDYNNACLEAICGNTDRAFELLQIALQTKQTYINWARNDPDLNSLHEDNRFKSLLTTYATSV